ncbi:HepT-like ribonuclease domain-containing protein [Anaerobaca lacustris]|uniref:DUF86 domain-containing protein n=1 Tax=Anaerobaca lacustris TaxID=3044600 RepID=A0AAW6TV00_9BACT|nr:DUF86 domain-containing protein [Sedimentisphaerales bacterium M17dextr]
MARLWDMLDAARTAVEFTEGVGFQDFLQDRKTRNAVERNLEILGEAARCVSQQTRESLSDIPWRSMIGLRNILTHEYGEIRYEVLWAVVHDKLTPLIERLEEIGVNRPPTPEQQ